MTRTAASLLFVMTLLLGFSGLSHAREDKVQRIQLDTIYMD
ncbi:MAG: hypothetical protein QF921_16805 [Pseudomonadales bacterium]|jgi:hypothetical protein|nr:hypothetical protein [Pseudomonadales bacterium]MDP6471125.1 hypothetical protein [Pseudomonadales bacterium]MDP6825689.1 hypothetical protein [Pseudomonadales bacterium]MDP6973145.1 hypothetical protein [Pseudomonadales bacterium]